MSDLDFAQAQVDAAVPAITLTPKAEAQYERITRNLQEHTGGEIIRKVLSDGEVVKAYWGEPNIRLDLRYTVRRLIDIGSAITGRR